jgi:hypothetical protein
LLRTERYIDQVTGWPRSGRHILAHYDPDSVVVYQAYRPSIGQFVVEHGHFGGEFSYSRMSWIKTNFLWMMYRSGWGMKAGQEITLAIRINQLFFENLLAQAVDSSFANSHFSTYAEWEHAIATSSVRMQWDPDHHPAGAALPRRALQLGLRRQPLKAYGKREIIDVLDLTTFVEEQRKNITKSRIMELIMPAERVYIPDDPDIRNRLRLDEINPPNA